VHFLDYCYCEIVKIMRLWRWNCRKNEKSKLILKMIEMFIY